MIRSPNSSPTFTDSQLKLYAEKFRCFDSSTKYLNEFYFNDTDLQSFKELSFLVKIILTLSYGQASVARSFSVDNTVIKACVRYFFIKFLFFLPNESPSKTMKNVFYFI